jgi:hypothetical protein
MATPRCETAMRIAWYDPRQLIRASHQLDVVTAFLEQVSRMGRLEVAYSDLCAGDMGGTREHRHVVAMRIE